MKMGRSGGVEDSWELPVLGALAVLESARSGYLAPKFWEVVALLVRTP